MEIRNFPRQDLLEFTRSLREQDQELQERSAVDEVLFAQTPGATLGEMQDNAALKASRLGKRSTQLAWASAGCLFGAGITFFGMVGTNPAGAISAGLALGAASGLALWARKKTEAQAQTMVHSRARLGTYGSVLAKLTEAENEVKKLASGLTPEQSLTIRQDEHALIVGGVRVKRHSGKSESCST